MEWRRLIVRDTGVALSLAAVLGGAWAFVRRHDLSRMRLPDTDDMTRLQQIRDWSDGQRFHDLRQMRFGIDGLDMHWSRLADIMPAAIMNLAGETVAVIVWPILLFAAFLFLSARLARATGTGAVDAMLLATLAYPATTLFAPGRIDHHGLQVVLLVAFALGLVTRSGVAGGAFGGLAAALSVTIGMETAPLLAMGGAIVAAGWIRSGDPRRPAAMGVALLLGLAAMAGSFAPGDWASAPCDGFTRASWRAGSLGGVALLMMAIAGRHAVTPRARLAAGAAIGLLAAGALWATAPACLSPYGAVDPLLARLWLREVGEAQSLLATDPRWAIGYAGIGVIAMLAAAWTARDARRVTLALMGATGLLLALAQLRGAYAAAALAPPMMAVAIERIRARHAMLALPAWVAAAGITWPLLATLVPVRDMPAAPGCADAGQAAAMAALPAGRVLGPVDLGPWLIAATPHQAIAAPYHRNAEGNLAAYRLFTADPSRARTIAQTARVDYVVACPASLAQMHADRDGLGAMLIRGESPGWLVATGVPHLWRVRHIRRN